jgi:molybdopterin synthase catalytic subunit
MKASVKISRKPISISKEIGSVASKSAGGTVTFIGTVRDASEGVKVTGMALESALDVARKDLIRISELAFKEFEIAKLNVTHRIGKLKVGEVIVVVAVSAAHRKDAFRACEFVIDELKKTTPIWKKEYSGSRHRWVKGEGR